MKLKTKALSIACLIFAVMVFTGGCKANKTPYEINDADQYNVSVKFDANGGLFTTNTTVIVDSYNLSELPVNSDGNAQIALLSPDDPARGNDKFTVSKGGCFLAGWYQQRTEIVDSEGNTSFVYSGKWDFEQDTLSVDVNGTYSSAEPELTLYAAWVPLFEIQFYDLTTGQIMHNYQMDLGEEILIPGWDLETGAMELHNFPEKKGWTFDGVYYDADKTQPVEETVLEHPGKLDEATGTATDHVLTLYVDWKAGEWYQIYTAEQFADNASVNGNYVICADLDFAEEIWPSSLMHGNFSGTILGNGHTFSNIELTQTNNSKVNSGLFGSLTETAAISDLTLDNITFIIKGGTRVAGANFGLFAGNIAENEEITNVVIQNSTLQIDSSCYFGTDDYYIGLVCGMGETTIDASDIACMAVGEKPESVEITVNDGIVTLVFKQDTE